MTLKFGECPKCGVFYVKRSEPHVCKTPQYMRPYAKKTMGGPNEKALSRLQR